MSRFLFTWCVALWLAMLWPAQAGAVNLPDCGGENQRTCKWTDQEYYDNGSHECEYDLKGSNGVCVNELRRTWNRRSAWTEWALRQQRYGVQGGEPVNWISNVGGHNAYSSLHQGFGYDQSNHKYSVTDQLRMGARVLEIDPHWSTEKPRVCHFGDTDQCFSYSRLMASLLDEVGNWLQANPDEVIFLKFDDHMGSHVDDFVTLVQHYLGNKVYKRASNARAWPTLAQMKAAGTQVLIGTRNNKFSGNSWFWYFDTDYVTDKDHPDQISTSNCVDGDGRIVYKRPAWMWSAVAEGRSWSNTLSQTGLIQPNSGTVAGLLRCGVSWIGLDYLDALDSPVANIFRFFGLDTRIEESIWSFERNEYGANGPMFMRGHTGRWASGPAATVRRFACTMPAPTGTNTYGREFRITNKADIWSRGNDTCRAEFGATASYGAPTLPYLNAQLATASGGAELWLNYTLVAQVDPLVQPGSLAFSGAAGAAAGTRELLVLARPALGQQLVVKSAESWIVVNALDGNTPLEPGNRYAITVDPATAPKTPGTHSAAIAVGYFGAGTPSQVGVSYNVTREADMALSFSRNPVRQPAGTTALVKLTSQVAGQPLSGGTVTLREVVPGTAGADTSLRVLGTAGLPPAAQAAEVAIALNSITVGSGSHTVFAEYTGGGNHGSSSSAARTLQVDPRIQVVPAAYSFNMASGGPLPAAQLVKVAGHSAPAFLAKLPPWASASTVNGDFFIGLNSVALQFAAGSYSGSFIVGDGSGVDTTVPITVNVALPSGALPALMVSTAGARRDQNVPLRVTNTGRGVAAAVQLTAVGIETLVGNTPVTLPGTVPLPLGSIAAGGSQDINLPLRWPAGAQRIRLTLTFTSNSGAYTVNRSLNLIR